MKILMISDVYWPRVNGVSTSIRTFSDVFRRQGHEVKLIVPAYDSRESDDAKIIRIPARKLLFDPEDRLYSVSSVRRLIPQFAQEQFDLIHIHTPFSAHYAGIQLGKKLSVPVLETYHTFFEEYLYHYIPILPKQVLRWFARRISRNQCNQVDHLVVPSTAMRDQLSSYEVRTPMSIIPTGIDLERFNDGDANAFRRDYRISPDRPLLLYVGRVAFEKNIELLFDAVNQLRVSHPDVLLLVAGEGPALSTLQRQADRRGLKPWIAFTGYFNSSHELASAYRAAHVSVFASHTETQGLVLLEAMACGTPVVACAVMGTRDVLRDGAGCLVAHSDPQHFAAQIAQILDNPSLRAELSSSALNYVNEWRAEDMAEKLLNLYREITKACA